jgi:hypothetical protein
MMAEQNGETPAQRGMLARLRKHRGRYEKAEQGIVDLRTERIALYREARALKPPLTFDEIADAVGITAAAVQQAIFKADNPKPPGKPGRPRGSTKRTAKAGR